MILLKIRNSRTSRIISCFLAINILAEIISPNVAMALTSGPSQPEVQSFEPVNTSEMVDLFSGDFKYNIPLMDVGGYPLNINYDSGVGMDQEASWVGLGWNLNVGAINRNMRGLPDDFNGQETIRKDFNMKDNVSYGGHVKLGFEVFGWGEQSSGGSGGTGNLTIGVAINYNNYTGIGVEQSANIGLSAGNGGKGKMNANFGLSSSASEGLNINHSLSFSANIDADEKEGKSNTTTTSASAGIAMGVNSRSGLKNLSFNTSLSSQNKYNEKAKTSKDNYDAGGSIGSEGTVNFGVTTYVPSIQFPMVNNSVALSFKLGITVFGEDGSLDVGGYYSNQHLSTKGLSLPAYGYLYSEDGQYNTDGLMDFNREKDGAYNRNMEHLPVTNFTYDVYSVAGQGVGGTYRPFRHDVGYVFDNEANTTSDSYTLGGEVDATETAHAGVDVSVVDVNTTTGKWTSQNNAKGKLSFVNSSSATDEPYAFKEVGEKSVDADPMFTAMGDFSPVNIKLQGHGMGVSASTNFETTTPSGAATTIPIPNNKRVKRHKRNQVISTLTVAEAKTLGLQTDLYNGGTSILPGATDARDHHIAEISVLRTDGSRYVYGLPAYNTIQKEVTFNASGNSQGGTSDVASGYVAYTGTAGDASTGNSKGIDNYFNKVTTPAYVHAYMLTGVVSPDYVDLTNDGPSDDDLGNYTKFNYEKVSGYEWRTPVAPGKANFNENTKSAAPQDDYANYVYGSKDVYYVHQITTKNYIAIFETQDRNDATAVDESGNPSAGRSKLLKSITLYSKPEYNKQQNSMGTYTAVPIKVAHFMYSYDLCPHVPNNTFSGSLSNPWEYGTSNNRGKLTLKQIYFTYGSSDKAKLSTYNFTYAGGNPVYDPKAYDRWGNYKPNALTGTSTPGDVAALGSVLPNWEYPYVDQSSQGDADNYSSSWSLTGITLPSGAEISVLYESDDYAYVQNLPAMNMCKVVALTNNVPASEAGWSNAPNVQNLMTSSTLSDPAGTNNNFLVFKLPKSIPVSSTGSSSSDYFMSHYLKDMYNGRFLYFRFLTNITKSGTPSNTHNYGDYFEYVSGYAEVEKDVSGIPRCGFVNPGTNTSFNYGYIALKSVAIDKTHPGIHVNPIAEAAWQMGRVNFPNLVWDASFQPNGGPGDVIRALVNSSITHNIIDGIKGPNLAIASKEYGKETVMNKSWIRLYEPTGKKYGGGCRVKRLSINDNWDDLTTAGTQGPQKDFIYGQTYEYTIEDNGQTISSGVAAYEPMIGGDEIPFRLPNYYTNQGNNPQLVNFLIPNDQFFTEEPYGESFYPSPNVGYSKVTVANLKRTDTYGNKIVKAHATGSVVHTFYTAKDYPTITKRTDLKKIPYNPPFGGLTKIFARDFMTTSQGYVIELNDMHGKPRGQQVYAEDRPGVPVSSIEYKYKTEGARGFADPGPGDVFSDARLSSNRLNNTCAVIGTDGTISSAQVGVDYDMVADFREHQTTTVIGGAQINLSVFLVGIFPGLVPTIWPDFSRDVTRFRSSVVTKVISRYGILEKTIATDLGSKVETSNLAYDSETGEVLLTKTFNDFEDQVYAFTYPAHWSYDLMGPAYKNIGAYANALPFSGGSAPLPLASGVFLPGDEVSLNSSGKAWVCNATSSGISLIDQAGAPVANGTYSIKVIRSGRRNQQSTPVGSVVSLNNPVDIDADGNINYGSQISFGNATYASKVVKAGAVEYADQWQMYSGYAGGKGACSCALTSIGTDMANLFGTLITNHHLEDPSTQLFASSGAGTYYNGFVSNLNNSLLHSSYPTLNDLYWNTYSESGNVAQFNIGPSAGSPASTCGLITATLPSGLNWTDIDLVAPQSYSMVLNTGAGCAAYMEVCATYSVHAFVGGGGTASTCFTVSTNNTCWPLINCTTTAATPPCAPNVGDVVNPYVQGIKGNWRMLKSWSYLADRSQTHNGPYSKNTDIRDDGIMKTLDHTYGSLIPFQPFWAYSAPRFAENPSYWTFTSQVTYYSPDGFELENKDALGRYSGVVYGYNESLPIAVGSNAQQQEIAYDGFEDYDYISTADCRKKHFNFYENKSKLSTTEAHTGLYSIKLAPGNMVAGSRNLPLACSKPTTYPSACGYPLHCYDFIPLFSPNAQKYVLSYWVKEVKTGGPSPTQPVLTYSNALVAVSITGSPISISQVVKSQVIDGWQRVELTFDVPAVTTAGTVDVTLFNQSSFSPVSCYFDDIRIHPFNSNMKSYVYNPVTLKYVAELDANNFATFYEYDEEGSLIRVKKETEKGIMTIQETKNHTKR